MSIKQRRQSIQLTDPQTAFLNDEARALGITVAELVRRIIDAWRFQVDRHPPNRNILNDEITTQRAQALDKGTPK